MTDDEQGIYDALPRLVQEFSGQLREATERLQGLAGLSGLVPPAAGALPLPGALSAAQMTAIADSIAAQRRSIEALQAQLTSFDEQLAALEQILGPMAEWSRTWAEFEQRILAIGHRPADKPLGGYRVPQEVCGLRKFLPLMAPCHRDSPRRRRTSSVVR
jgi:hypothetical protein